MFSYSGDNLSACIDLVDEDDNPVPVSEISKILIFFGGIEYTELSPEVSYDQGNTIKLALTPAQTENLISGQKIVCKVQTTDGLWSTVLNTLALFKQTELTNRF